ncbi:S-adenosyl-L-methionine-dependent methyltransferase [Durotheca rogersii]|uniref:S-adenosyl-L-methionine-dependent methyltransferase n=1 Tax=Durotheca rogersii TaxID=419775 RepID=UPI00221FD95C|nr:S-adenosyl-L-methionine-dependent methyltransferase [Durotheca rogersii]KAI5856175.1 S-adenosyl-L-methionine-dependent methyltransferase [Durotheca rogersii]
MCSTPNLVLDAALPSELEKIWGEEQPVNGTQAAIERRFRELLPGGDNTAIDLTEGRDGNFEAREQEYEDAINLEPDIAKVIEVVDLTTRKRRQRFPRGAIIPRRNPSIAPPDCRLESYTHNNTLLKSGVTVEIMPPEEDHFYASFLYIQSVVQTEAAIVLRGLPLTRTRYLRGKLPRLRNEIAFVLCVDQDDSRPDEEQAAIEIPLDRVRRTRTCYITNKNFPEHRYPGELYDDVWEIEERAALVCRWKYRRIWGNALQRLRKQPPLEFVLTRIGANEVPKDKFRAPDVHLTNAWRGGKVRGGASAAQGQLIVHVDDPDVQETTPGDGWAVSEPGQQYTLADMFCGAGGASYGARSAGFRIALSCDKAEGACNTYAENFPEAELHRKDMYDFIDEMRNSYVHVDVLHLSPPCQYWSPAHTTPGVNDEANIAILSCCHELVKIFRPRVFTLEQTYGILHSQFEYYFNALVRGFTQYNYSVRWKVVNLLSWGSPARRLRLIMIGACAGEELPPYPGATHAADPTPSEGTRPYRTVRQVLRQIPRRLTGDRLHKPRELKRIYKPRWNPDLPLARTITCNGGVGNYHFNGRRDFTLREYAVLQGFPADYKFEKPDQKKQIGNAFPPPAVETLFRHLRKWLEQRDRIYADDSGLAESEGESSGGVSVDYDVEDDDDDEYYGSDVEYLGERELSRSSSEVECLGGWNLRRQASVVTVKDSDESDDDMETDAMSEDAGSPNFCADGAQSKAQPKSGPIDLTKVDDTGLVDLT